MLHHLAARVSETHSDAKFKGARCQTRSSLRIIGLQPMIDLIGRAEVFQVGRLCVVYDVLYRSSLFITEKKLEAGGN